jgi:hypothetical protein
MNQLFGDIEGCEIIVDDILICGRDEVEHDERLLKVLERARNIGMRLNLKKRNARSKYQSLNTLAIP